MTSEWLPTLIYIYIYISFFKLGRKYDNIGNECNSKILGSHPDAHGVGTYICVETQITIQMLDLHTNFKLAKNVIKGLESCQIF